MKVLLKDLQANPFRDFSIDPINDEAVEKLQQSIESHDFWQGLVVRKVDTGYQLVFGHHRVAAAKACGLKHIEAIVVDWGDDQMVKAMATENVTQRDNNFSAIANDVAAAMRVLGKVMVDTPRYSELPEDAAKLFDNAKSYDTCRGKFLRDEGLGLDLLGRYFDDQIGERLLREAIAQMKQSGKLREIMKELGVEIKRDKPAPAPAPKDGEKAPKPAPAPAPEPEPVFDMRVGQVFTQPSHLAEFRRLMTTPTSLKLVPVGKQVAFAADVKRSILEATRNGRPVPLTTNEISKRVKAALSNVRGLQKKERERLIRNDKQEQAQHEWSFARNKLAHAHGHVAALGELLEEGIRPNGFDPEEARHWFEVTLPRFNAEAEKVRGLLADYDDAIEQVA